MFCFFISGYVTELSSGVNTWIGIGFKNKNGNYCFLALFSFGGIYYAKRNNADTFNVHRIDSLTGAFTLPSTQDFNDLTFGNIYYIGDCTNMTNRPTGCSYTALVVLRLSGSVTIQIIVSHDKTWVRKYFGSPLAWTSWRVYTSAVAT